MKTIGTLSAKNAFGTASALEITPELQSAALQFIPDNSNNAIQHCGCDNKQGIEMYVQNLISDAKQRGMSCQDAMHIPACITTYCSICKGHAGLVENCIKAGVEYFTSTADFCSQQQPGVAAYMPDMQFLSQVIKTTMRGANTNGMSAGDGSQSA